MRRTYVSESLLTHSKAPLNLQSLNPMSNFVFLSLLLSFGQGRLKPANVSLRVTRPSNATQNPIIILASLLPIPILLPSFLRPSTIRPKRSPFSLLHSPIPPRPFGFPFCVVLVLYVVDLGLPRSAAFAFCRERGR